MNPEAAATIDLDAYFARIGYGGPRKAAPDVLRELHLAHATHIPFENIDIHLGQSIRLELDHLQSKLVAGRRGGYCFEHNTLLAAALEATGFHVTRLAARVRFGADRILPRTHMLLEVAAGGTSYLCDVGFGAEGPLEPIPLVPGREVPSFERAFRLTEEAGQLVLQSRAAGPWQDLYAFTREPQYPVDFEVANHFTSTHPQSIFVQTITAQRQGPAERIILRNRQLTVERNGSSQARTIADANSLRSVLAEHFGLEFSVGQAEAAFRSAVAGTGLWGEGG